MASSTLSNNLIQLDTGADTAFLRMPRPFTVSLHALGCRLNQSEAGSLEGGFAAAGFQVVGQNRPSDIAVINTCSVTQQAEAKCRNLIRRILRRNPKTFIAVTGCYAQVGLEALRKMGGVDLIAGTDQKMTLPALVEALIEGVSPFQKRDTPLVFHSPRINREDFTVSNMAVFDHATRPNVKIQDGCDFFCTFCIIPYTRGRSRSRNFEDVILEANIWVKRGHREIVLTGVNLGEYRSQGKDLVDLIESLEQIEDLERIRISSIEPTTVSTRLLNLMARSEKLCSYVHLPLQSGSDAVLSEMGRRYTRQDYIDFVKEAVGKIPNLGLGTDVMVGFPGEDESNFQETLALIESLPFSYLHVFSYSGRKGTRVTRAHLPPVHPGVIKKRSKLLCDLSRKKRVSFYGQVVGQAVQVLFETRNKAELFCGLTENYIRVGVATDQDLSGQIRRVQIDAIRENLAEGSLIA